MVAYASPTFGTHPGLMLTDCGPSAAQFLEHHQHLQNDVSALSATSIDQHSNTTSSSSIANSNTANNNTTTSSFMAGFTSQKSGRRTVGQFRRIEPTRRPQRRRIHAISTKHCTDTRSSTVSTTDATRTNISTKKSPCLLSLPDDVLSLVVHHVMSPLKLSGQTRVVEQSYKAGLALSQTCRRFEKLFETQLRSLELWQSRNISACCVIRLARTVGTNLKRLVLRGCETALNDGSALKVLAQHCPNIQTLDVSHTKVTTEDMVTLLTQLKHLRELRIRGCVNLGNEVLQTIGKHCRYLIHLDASDCNNITKSGISALFSKPVSKCLRVLALSRCRQIDDESLKIISKHAKEIHSLTLRGLSLITNNSILRICESLGSQLTTLDVLDCERINVDCFIEYIHNYCPNISWRIPFQNGRSLKQVIISSLAGNIFYVTGSDICNGKSAVYFLLVDSGTYDSFRVSIGSSSLDLTNFGSILASCFGNHPNQFVKDTMFLQYGLDLANDNDNDDDDDGAVVSIR